MAERRSDVWGPETVDDGAYRCGVERIGEYTGTLWVVHVATGEEIAATEVGLAYAARFGPDVDDVSTWMAMVIEVIDRWAAAR